MIFERRKFYNLSVINGFPVPLGLRDKVMRLFVTSLFSIASLSHRHLGRVRDRAGQKSGPDWLTLKRLLTFRVRQIHQDEPFDRPVVFQMFFDDLVNISSGNLPV